MSQPDKTGYEQTRDELVAVVQQLEAGGLTLEESLALWQRGEELAAACQVLLAGAQTQLDAATSDDEQEITSPE